MNTDYRPYGGTHTLVDIDIIRVNHKKLRKLSNAKIAQYLRDYESGDDFPPITVDDCNGFYTINDGRHRYQAQLAAGFAKVAVIVR
jgi:ParB-like chromosome segregation protein Spo0J